MRTVVASMLGLALLVPAAARADASIVAERGLRLCEPGCFDIDLIEIIDHVGASAFTGGPPNSVIERREGIRIVIKGAYDPITNTHGPSKTFTGTLRPPDGYIVWSPASGGGNYRGTVVGEQGGRCYLTIDWWAFGGGAPLRYDAGAGASVGREGSWPIGFYAHSSQCGLGGNSYADPRGVAWEQLTLSVAP